MRTETILNAMEKTISLISIMGDAGFKTIRFRQYRTFRDRILRMDAEKDEAIRLAKNYIRNTEQQLAEKDTRVAETALKDGE